MLHRFVTLFFFLILSLLLSSQFSFIRRTKGENVFVRHSNLMLEVGKNKTPEVHLSPPGFTCVNCSEHLLLRLNSFWRSKASKTNS